MDNKEIVPITSLDQFAQMIADWHANRVAQLEHSLTIPDEVEIVCGLTDSGEEISLTPEQRQGFKVGLTVALGMIQELPFTSTVEPEQTEGECAAPEGTDAA